MPDADVQATLSATYRKRTASLILAILAALSGAVLYAGMHGDIGRNATDLLQWSVLSLAVGFLGCISADLAKVFALMRSK